jgi:hypothetical protein
VTIAVCYLSPEGVVLGADSTASLMVPEGGFHYFNNNQKMFEIGEDASLAAMTWGLASLGSLSHRSALATLADNLEANNPKDLKDVADRWADQFWTQYASRAAADIALCKSLDGKKAFDPTATTPDPAARNESEEKDYRQLRLGLVVGFCLGGHVLPDRTPGGFEIIFDPLKDKPIPTPIPTGSVRCWGTPKIFDRLINAVDTDVKQSIMKSGKWAGTEAELTALIAQHALVHPILPIRDAIDFVHACISSTIKALKFSRYSQTCGGPIEIAVITTDRPFRWVRHKDWDVAINEGTF